MTRTIIVFLEYKDSEEWFGRELLSDGKILYACNDTINVVTYREKEPDYNEIIIVKYAENAMCDDAVERLNQFASKLKSYKVFQVKPCPEIKDIPEDFLPRFEKETENIKKQCLIE